MGEEIYYVRVATAHTAHACAGLPKQIPPERACHSPDTTHQRPGAGGRAKRDDSATTDARRLTHRPQVQCARVFVAESAISMWDRGIAGSHSLAPVHCRSCATAEHLSSVRSIQLGESRWVKRYIMCVWPLLTQHMHARACQSRYPLGRPAALDTPSVPPGRATCGAQLTRTGSDMRQRGMSVVATAHSRPLWDPTPQAEHTQALRACKHDYQ